MTIRTRRRTKLLALALLLTSAAAAASDAVVVPGGGCGNMRLDGRGKPLEHVPAMDQGDMQICYAYTATELADAWRFSHGRQPPPGGYRLSSPLACAVEYDKSAGRKKGLAGGEVDKTLDLLRSNGSCDKRAVLGPYGSSGYGEEEITSTLSAAYQKFNDYLSDRAKLIPGKSELVARYGTDRSGAARAMAHELRCELESHASLPADATLSSLSDADTAIARMLEDGSRGDFLVDYFARACRNHRIDCSDVPKLKTRWFDPGQGRQAQGYLHALLDRADPEPVQVTLCSGVLKSRRPFSGPVKTAQPNGDDFYSCTDNPDTHSVLVIGERADPRTGRCQFLLRNSWGTDCTQYQRAGWECESNGQIWVDSTDLGANTVTVGSLDY